MSMDDASDPLEGGCDEMRCVRVRESFESSDTHAFRSTPKLAAASVVSASPQPLNASAVAQVRTSSLGPGWLQAAMDPAAL